MLLGIRGSRLLSQGTWWRFLTSFLQPPHTLPLSVVSLREEGERAQHPSVLARLARAASVTWFGALDTPRLAESLLLQELGPEPGCGQQVGVAGEAGARPGASDLINSRGN